MAQKCPSCGAEVPPQNPFCGTCGAKVDAAPAQGPGGGEAGGGPRTLGQLVRQVVKGMVTGFVKNLPMTIAVMAVVTVIHTYLLVVVNEGFAGGDPLLGLILVLQGNELPVAIFWLLAGTLGFAAVCQVREKRLAGTLGSVGQIPAIFRGSFDGSKPLTLSVLLFGAAFMVAVMSWLGNVLVGIQLAIVLLGALIAQGESLTAMALRLGYSDFKKNRGQQQAAAPYNPSWTGVAIAGSLAGMVLALLLNPGGMTGLILGIVLAAAGYLMIGRSGGPRPVAPLLLFCALAFAAMVVVPVLADDGGWQESGGTFGGWVQSEGAVQAVAHGGVAGVAAAAGVALGAILGGAGGGFGAAGTSVLVGGGYTAVSSLGGGPGGSTASPPGGSSPPSSLPPPKGHFDDGRPYWGEGTRDDPFRDYPDAKQPPYMPQPDGKGPIWGEGTRESPYTDVEPPIFDHTPLPPEPGGGTKPASTPLTKPEVKPETKLEPKPETKPATKPEAKPEVKPETKPEPKPETKPATKPETKPETKPGIKLTPQPASKGKTTIPPFPRPSDPVLDGITGADGVGGGLEKGSDTLKKTRESLKKSGDFIKTAKKELDHLKDSGMSDEGRKKLGYVLDKTGKWIDKTGKKIEETGEKLENAANLLKKPKEVLDTVEKEVKDAVKDYNTTTKKLENAPPDLAKGKAAINAIIKTGGRALANIRDTALKPFGKNVQEYGKKWLPIEEASKDLIDATDKAAKQVADHVKETDEAAEEIFHPDEYERKKEFERARKNLQEKEKSLNNKIYIIEHGGRPDPVNDPEAYEQYVINNR